MNGHPLLLLFALLLCTALPALTDAQVTVGGGVQQLYDTNIFLENTAARPTLEGAPIPKDDDGKRNADFITYPFIQGATSPSLTRYLRTSGAGKLGGAFFADETGEARATVDTNLLVSSTEALLRKPFYVDLSSRLNSTTTGIGTAQGTAANLAETHTAALSFGASGYELTPRDRLGMGYTLTRQDYLGEFLLSDRSAESRTTETEGIDLFAHEVSSYYSHDLSERLSLFLRGAVGYVDYSSTTPVSFTDGSLPSAELAQNNDRLRYTPSLGVRTAVSPALSLEARAGIDIQSLTTDPELTGVSQEGESTTVFSREKSFETLSYSATANYLPLDGTSGATGEVYQSGGSDIDGQRLTIRGLSLTSFHRFNERIQGIVSGRYLQYSYENSLTNASERWESTVSLRYQLTETLEVSSGWNFANQNSSGSEADEEGYESHRFFIALSGSMSL